MASPPMSFMSICDAKLRLDALEDGGSGKLNSKWKSSREPKKLLAREGEGGVGGRSAFGGAALRGGTSSRDEEALRTRTTGRLATEAVVDAAEVGNVVEFVSVEDVRVRVNVMGDEEIGELLFEGACPLENVSDAFRRRGPGDIEDIPETVLKPSPPDAVLGRTAPPTVIPRGRVVGLCACTNERGSVPPPECVLILLRSVIVECDEPEPVVGCTPFRFRANVA